MLIWRALNETLSATSWNGVATPESVSGAAPSAGFTLPLGLPWLGAHFRIDALSAFFLVVVDLGGAGVGPERLDAGGFEPVDQAGDQRDLRADDDEVDGPVGGKGDDAVDVIGGDVDAFGDPGDAGVARRAV